MPRKSSRQQAIEMMSYHVHHLRLMNHHHDAIDDNDSIEDERLINQTTKLREMENSCYLFHSTNYRVNRNKFDLEDALSYTSTNFNNEEFICPFCLSRDSFFLITWRDEKKKSYCSDFQKKQQQRPIAYQLLVFLYRVGKEGCNGGSLQVTSFFGIGKGLVNNYIRRVVKTLLEIKNETVSWPMQKWRRSNDE